jgi:CRISPR/Cas system CSM-associated protein Csm2 small subunit
MSYYSPFRIVELDQMLRKNREEAQTRNDPTGTIRARVAAVQAQKEEAEKNMIVARTAKIKSYLEYGYSRQDISQMLGIHPYTLDTIISRIEKEDKQMDRIRLGWKRDNGGYVCLTPGLPTRR